MSDRLGTAQWEDPAAISQKYPYAPGTFWLGRAEDGGAVGYRDDRHICLVSGTRGGKGASIIINNLCMWPGSAVVVDPKGENATVTAARRGNGAENCDGMGQAVHVLDPFKESKVDVSYQSCFNPLDTLDPENEETLDDAERIASALIVVRENAAEPFWDEAAHDMVRGLILYVLTAAHFAPDERNLITVRKLILNGEWQIEAAIREQGHDPEKIDPPHLLMWRSMERSNAFDGVVSGIGSRFRSMMKSEKMYEGIVEAAVVNTKFIDSPGMKRVLSKSDFKLSELKSRPEGMTLYLSLPQRYMATHYRWLRMMVALTINDMEIHPEPPKSGHPVLMVLDEFAGLQRMTMIENAVAQLAGFGVKLFYVLQTLEQLKGTYKDHWETFVANAGIKIFFGIGDPFTQKYVSAMAGFKQINIDLHNVSQSIADSESVATGSSQSHSVSRSISDTTGTSSSLTEGASHSFNRSNTDGTSTSQNSSENFGSSSSYQVTHPFWSKKLRYNQTGAGTSQGVSHGTTAGTSSSMSRGITNGTSSSTSQGTSKSQTFGSSQSETYGSSETRTQGISRTEGMGRSESVHRKPLIEADEVGRFFTRIDDKTEPAYPGLALVMVTGGDPLRVRRAHYFQDPMFMDSFAPHPDHKFLPAVTRPIENLITVQLDVISSALKTTPNLRFLVQRGDVVDKGQPIAMVEGLPNSQSATLRSPFEGKVIETGGEWFTQGHRPGVLFSIKTYDHDQSSYVGEVFGDLLGIASQLHVQKRRALDVEKETAARAAERRSPKRIAKVAFWTAVLIVLFAFVVRDMHQEQAKKREIEQQRVEREKERRAPIVWPTKPEIPNQKDSQNQGSSPSKWKFVVPKPQKAPQK